MQRFALIGVFLAFLVAPLASGAAAQDHPTSLAQASSGSGLSDQEQRDFDARLRAATTDQERKRIQDEREILIQTRVQRQGVAIPPSPGEMNDDVVMPGVPVPPLGGPRPTGNTLPGGALSGTGTGTSPAINPGAMPDGR